MKQVNETAEIDAIDQTSKRSAPVMLHDLSRVGIVPEFPVVRYIGYLIRKFRTTLNLLHKWLENHSRVLGWLFGLMKRLLIPVEIIAISLLGLVVWGILDLFKVYKEINPTTKHNEVSPMPLVFVSDERDKPDSFSSVSMRQAQ